MGSCPNQLSKRHQPSPGSGDRREPLYKLSSFLESCPNRPSNQDQSSPGLRSASNLYFKFFVNKVPFARNLNSGDRRELLYKLSPSLESFPTQLSNESKPFLRLWPTKMLNFLESSSFQPSNEDQPPSETWSSNLLSSLESSLNRLWKETQSSNRSQLWLFYSLKSSLKQLSKRSFLAPGPRHCQNCFVYWGPVKNFCLGGLILRS